MTSRHSFFTILACCLVVCLASSSQNSLSKDTLYGHEPARTSLEWLKAIHNGETWMLSGHDARQQGKIASNSNEKNSKERLRYDTHAKTHHVPDGPAALSPVPQTPPLNVVKRMETAEHVVEIIAQENGAKMVSVTTLQQTTPLFQAPSPRQVGRVLASLPASPVKSPTRTRYDYVKLYKVIKDSGQSMLYIGKVHQLVDPKCTDIQQGCFPEFGLQRSRQVVLKMAGRNTQFGLRLQREAVLLNRMDHPNIIKIEDEIPDTDHVVLVLPYYSLGSLQNRFKEMHGQKIKVTPNMVRRIFYPIVKALDYCHAQGVAHRDVKPDNIVLDGTLDAPIPKLIDFGYAYSDDINHFESQDTVGTLNYSAPEITSLPLTHSVDPFKLDVWSLGVSILCAVLGREFQDFISVLHWMKEQWKGNMFGFGVLLKGMLDPNPSTRWTMAQVKEYAWWEYASHDQNQ